MPDPFKDHFSSVAGNYAAFRPDYPPELFQWLAGIVEHRARAWDCATGNGQAAVRLVEFFDQVIATDASADQISNATRHPKVQYSVAPAESSGLEAQSVDLITVAQSVHWFNFDQFFAETKRVLRPGGVIALWCYAGIEFRNSGIQKLMDDFYHNTVGPYWPPERQYIEDHYRTIPFPFAELTLPAFSMDAEFTLERLLGYLRTWSATQRFIKAKGFDPVDQLGDALREVWGERGHTPEINWPIHVRVGQIDQVTQP